MKLVIFFSSLTILRRSHSLSHLFASQFISISAIHYILLRNCQKQITYVNVSWITGHETLLNEVANAKDRSLWKPGLSWFFSCSNISNIVNLKFVIFRLVILGHDWNIWARSSNVSSFSHSCNVCRFFIEQITLTNRELRENGYLAIKWWLFCKYPSSDNHSKVVKRHSSTESTISNDLHIIIMVSQVLG